MEKNKAQQKLLNINNKESTRKIPDFITFSRQHIAENENQ